MITWILSRLRRAHEDDRGVVLANVIIFGMVMMTIVAGMALVSTSGAIKSASDRNYQNAMAAAYAGLADYQSKISNNNSYAFYDNGASAFTAPTKTNLPPTTNPALTTSGPTWATVSGSTDEFYRYEVDNSDFETKGQLRVRVTGKSGNITRSLVADLRGDGFVNYLYFTNYESSDPSTTFSNTTCTVQYQYLQNTKNRCPAVQFASTDTLNGPVRTNDDFTSCGGKFNGTVEDHDGTVYPANASCATPSYAYGGPTPAPSLPMPALNSTMSQEARTDLPAQVAKPGCLYTGPTKVLLNSNGTMTVWSPWTRATQITVDSAQDISASSPNSVSAQAECGAISALQSAAGATIPTLPENLMYVQDVPTSNSPTNVNYWGSAFPSGYTNTYCTTQVTVSGSRSSTSTASAYSNGVGFPVANEWIYNGSTSSQGSASSTYPCQSGDVFVSGVMSGQMTIASSGTVWVTGDITYNDPTNDILGLVGQDAVEVWNPAKCTATGIAYSWGGPVTYCAAVGLLNRSANAALTIDAAIASNAGTFWVQNNMIGPALGKLTVAGSIAQYYRGTVATSNGNSGGVATGFSKNYVYDNRLLSTAPPKFLQPVATTYGVTTQVEVAPAYNADGSCAQTAAGACR